MQFDLLITNGHVIDPASGVDGPRDIGVVDGRVAAVEERIVGAPAASTIDAAGCLVLPGLIDLHSHLFRGGDYFGIDADSLAWRSGVTTWVDAGSTGAFRLPALRELVAGPARARILALIHISYVGLAGLNYDEYCNPDACNVELLEAVVAAHRDFIVGIKVRMGADGFCDPDLEPLRRAVEAGDRTSLPVMCHISGVPPTLGEVLRELRPGDTVTHSFTGAGQRLVDDRGDVLDVVREARDRGVGFDIGHGAGSFSFASAEALARSSFWPDTISTDLHQLSLAGPNLVADQQIIGEVRGDGSPQLTLLTVMTKLLHLGMPLCDIVRAVTATPASWMSRPELGSLGPGAAADVAVLRIEDGPVELVDIEGRTRTAQRSFRSVETLVDGVPLPRKEVPSPPPWIRLVDRDAPGPVSLRS